MIKITFCLKRLPSLTRAAFHDYWLNQHAPLVQRHREVLRIRRYVQLHSGFDEFSDKLRALRDAPEPFDGVAQLWWQSVEDLAAPMAEPAGRAARDALVEDEGKFIDLARSPVWFGAEHVIFE